MSSTMGAILTAGFLMIGLFIVWLKYREHLHQHRHEHGPHTHHTNPFHSRHYR